MGSLFSRFRVPTTVVPEHNELSKSEEFFADSEGSTSVSSMDYINRPSRPPLSPPPVKRQHRLAKKTPPVPNFFDKIVMDSTF